MRAFCCLVYILFRQAKISDPNISMVIQKHILRLQIPVNDSFRMQVSEGEHDLGGVITRSRFLEATYLGEMEEQLATGTVIQHEVKFIFRLECVLESDNERMKHLPEHAPFGLRMGNLVPSNYVRFIQHFHGIDAIVALLPDLHDLPERSLSDHFQQLKIV